MSATAQTCREVIAALAPAARAFARAQTAGLVVADEQLGFVCLERNEPSVPTYVSSDQLTLDHI